MKKHVSGVVVAIAATLGSSFVAAKAIAVEPGQAVSPAVVDSTFISPDSPEAQSYRMAGDRAIDRFGVTIVSEAAKAARTGPVDALPLCHLKGIPMQNGTVGGVARIAAIKLTSLKVRNPDNAPDAAEQLALKKVQAGLDSGTPPAILVQQVTFADGRNEWRVYRPVAVMKQCAVCHGPADQQSPELRAALQAKYPSDQALGYSVGEWRGLIRVTVTDPPAPKPAPAPKKS